MTQVKKWVFTELVEDSNDPTQLIAYAMYKADKDDHAIQCRTKQNLSEDEISIELIRFHDSIVHSDRKLEEYREKAHRMIDQLIVGVNEGVGFRFEELIRDLNKTHEKEIAALKITHEKECKRIWKDWTVKAEKFTAHLTKEPWYISWPKAFLKWIFSGIPGLLATAFTTAVIIAVVAIFSDNGIEASRKALHITIDTLMKDYHGVDLPLNESNPKLTKPP